MTSPLLPPLDDGSRPQEAVPTALVERLSAATAGSWELDEEIADALCKSKFRTCIKGLSDEKGGLWMYEFDGHSPSSALRVTQSLDAALALAERVLPGWTWCLSGPREKIAETDDARPSASLSLDCDRPRFAIGVAATSPLSLCIAILRALEASR